MKKIFKALDNAGFIRMAKVVRFIAKIAEIRRDDLNKGLYLYDIKRTFLSIFE